MKRIATLSLVLFALTLAAPATFAAEKATCPKTGAACTMAADSSTTSTKSKDGKTTGSMKKKGKKHAKPAAK
jgi:hypothetical protein